MVVEYIPAFSTEKESGHSEGRISVGPGITEAFAVGIGVGGVVITVVGTRVGVGVSTGFAGGEEQPATARTAATTSASEMKLR